MANNKKPRKKYTPRLIINPLVRNEKYLDEVKEGESFQLLRIGYYKTAKEGGKTVLHEITSLKDTYKPAK